MNKYRTLFSILTILIFMYCAGNLKAHGQITVELYGGVGYSGVDLEAWSQSDPNDWGQFMGEVYATAYPLHFGNISLGAEVGYQHFFWYTTPVPGYSWSYEYNVDAIRLLLLMRANLYENLFIEFGPGAFLFGEWTDYGLMASVGYRVDITEKIAIPVKLRTEIILDKDSNLYPVGLSFGVSYTL